MVAILYSGAKKNIGVKHWNNAGAMFGSDVLMGIQNSRNEK